MPTKMPDIRPFHRTAVLNSIALVDSVRVADLGAPTPCAGWNLAALLAHMTAQHRGFSMAAKGFGDDTDLWRADAVIAAITADPAGTYSDAAHEVLAAFADDAALQASFALPEFGPDAKFPGAIAIGFHFIDYVVHGWDVAESMGLAYSLPDDVVGAALPLALAVPDGDFRETPDAPFARALKAEAAQGAPDLDRILRHLGRSPDWAGRTETANRLTTLGTAATRPADPLGAASARPHSRPHPCHRTAPALCSYSRMMMSLASLRPMPLS